MIKKILYFLGLLLIIFICLTLGALINQKKEVPTVQSQRNIARDKLQDLINTSYWSHTDSNGCDFTCRTKELGFIWIGEDLYKNENGDCDLMKAYEAWTKSPEHKAILDHIFNRFTIEGYYKSGKCYIVLDKFIE